MTDLIKLTKQWLETFPEGDFDAYPGNISPDFVLRLPFAPEGVPKEFRGAKHAQQVLAQTAKNRSPLLLKDVVIRATDDPDLIITTAKGSARLANGNLYKNEYVMFTRFQDGAVIEHTEYFNPLILIEANQPKK